MSYNNQKNETDSAFDCGMIVASPQKVDEDGIPYAIRPTGSIIESLEEYLPLPIRTRQTVHLHTPESFIQYVKAFAEPNTVIFFNESLRTFEAIIDYHCHKQPMITGKNEPEKDLGEYATDGPRWCDHRAIYSALETPEWAAWTATSGRHMTQAMFTQFIELHISDVAATDREIIQALALMLEIKKTVTFNSSQTLQNGSSSLLYVEEVEGTTRSGTVKIPAKFNLSIVPLKGGKVQVVPCRLLHRLDGRNALLWHEIVNTPEILEITLASIHQNIALKTEVPVLMGVPS